MQLSAEPGVRCWAILCVAVIRWELDAPLNCLGGCLQGMTSYDAAWGAESAETGCWPKHLPSKTSRTATHSSDLYNEWLINPFRLSHILFWPHWAALWSVEYQPSMSTGSTLMRTESQTQWRHYYNSWGLLFLILLVFCLPFRIDIVELRCDLRPGTWIYWSPCQDTDILAMVKRLAVKLSCLQPLISLQFRDDPNASKLLILPW